MASLLVKKHAGECADTDELLDALARHIPSAVEQTQFRKSVTSSQLTQSREHWHTGRSVSKVADPTPRVELSASELERITRILAQHVGPLASRIITRAQQNTAKWPDFCNDLADCIDSENEKQVFLRRMAKLARNP